MVDTIADNVGTGATLSIGIAATSAIDTLGDHDWYAVTLTAGETYLFNLAALAPGGLEDPVLTIYNSSGLLEAFNDDANVSIRDSQIRFTASTSGTYYLDAAGMGDQYAGNYTISATVAPPIPVYTLDEIADYLTDGYWQGAPYQFATSTISYSVQGLTAAEQALAELALQAWDEVAAFTFLATTGAAQVSFDNGGSQEAFTDADGTVAIVHISSDINGGDTSIFGATFQTYLREIGHALGLGNAGPYSGNAIYGAANIYANDSWATTVMSDFSQDEAGTGSFAHVVAPQLADIIAIGNLYGSSTTTRSGDTTYGFGANAGQRFDFGDAIYGGVAPALTLFDTGGTDALDTSGYAVAQRIDLRSETWSDIGGQINNIAIARGTVIENAAGGAGSDQITGNAADNLVYGRGGDDTIDGGQGSDTLFGDAGHDILVGGEGNDVLVGNADIFASESDTLDGGAGDDVIHAEFTDTVVGGSGTDYLYAVNSYAWTIDLWATGIEWISAGFGADTINGASQSVGIIVYAGGGNDVVTGSALADQLWAGVGDDIVIGGGGGDVIIGDLGSDSLYGGDGDDSIYADGGDGALDGGSGTDALYVTGGTGMALNLAGSHFEWVGDYAGGNDNIDGASLTVAAVVYAGGGADTITGGGGGDFLWGEAGNDVISGGIGDDTLVGGSGADVLTGGAGLDNILANSGGGGDGAADVIVFDAGWGTDFVYDFEHGIDKLDLSATGATAGTIVLSTSGGHAWVAFGGDLIVVAGASATLTVGDIIF